LLISHRHSLHLILAGIKLDIKVQNT